MLKNYNKILDPLLANALAIVDENLTKLIKDSRIEYN